MAQYAGDKTVYPADVYMPDDSAEPTAAEFLPAMEGTLDRTANLDERVKVTREMASALSFGAAVARGSGAQKSAWSEFDKLWWNIGAGNDSIAFSTDYGFTWNASSLAGATTTAQLVDLDIDDSGAVVVLGSQYSVHYSGGTSGTWTRQTVFASAPGGTPYIVYDPIHFRWCAAGYDTGQRVHTSTAPNVSWSAATSPLTGTQRPIMAINKTSGRIILLNTSGGTTIKSATSDDGGQTWTARADLVPGISSLSSSSGHIALAHSAADGCWLMFVQNGGSTSEVYKSTDDGVTWTGVRTIVLLNELFLRGPFMKDFAVLGSLWVAYANGKNGVIYSRDKGVTWRASGWRPSTSSTTVNVATGNGMTLLSATISGSGYAYPSAAKTDLFGTVL